MTVISTSLGPWGGVDGEANASASAGDCSDLDAAPWPGNDVDGADAVCAPCVDTFAGIKNGSNGRVSHISLWSGHDWMRNNAVEQGQSMSKNILSLILQVVDSGDCNRNFGCIVYTVATSIFHNNHILQPTASSSAMFEKNANPHQYLKVHYTMYVFQIKEKRIRKGSTVSNSGFFTIILKSLNLDQCNIGVCSAFSKPFFENQWLNHPCTLINHDSLVSRGRV